MRNRFTMGDRQFQVDQPDPTLVCIQEDEQIREIVLDEGLPQGKGRMKLGNTFVPYFATETPSAVWVTLAGQTYVFEKARGRGGGEEPHGGFCAPMPGKVIKVSVSEGSRVEKGQVLVIMEAMKMEHRIEAPGAGTVTQLYCKEGAVVEQGLPLLEFEPD